MNRISNKLAGRLLDTDLANSSWRETYPKAYEDLLEYRQDIEQSFRQILSDHFDRVRKELLE
ncbi:hypothetical protein LCGC14_0481810 [marine sediment metagenome]|uniref:Uncharacterized protein n=1 Tax=marine sediment metagenome TaxID=412755 RepID=A0A0F9UW97_9ZZZZ